jgi:hypothetical protein
LSRHHHHVYVVELDDGVWNEPRFRKANPDHRLGMPCVYVGMTGLDPDIRFDKHKAGIQSNRFVREYGLRLMPELYEMYNPMPYEGAREMEVELAIGCARPVMACGRRDPSRRVFGLPPDRRLTSRCRNPHQPEARRNVTLTRLAPVIGCHPSLTGSTP